jgi:hypothetical protein
VSAKREHITDDDDGSATRMARQRAGTGDKPPQKHLSADLTPSRKAAFIAKLSDYGVVRYACEQSGVARGLAYTWRDDDPEFAADWAEAIETATDAMEQEAIRRGVLGYEKPIYGKGKGDEGMVVVGVVTEYSDRLLELMLKANRGQKFRERVDVQTSGTVTHIAARDVMTELDELEREFDEAFKDAGK